jgi:hypothetical protein
LAWMCPVHSLAYIISMVAYLILIIFSTPLSSCGDESGMLRLTVRSISPRINFSVFLPGIGTGGKIKRLLSENCLSDHCDLDIKTSFVDPDKDTNPDQDPELQKFTH